MTLFLICAQVFHLTQDTGHRTHPAAPLCPPGALEGRGGEVTRMKQQLARGGWGRALCSEGRPPKGALIHTEGRGQDGPGEEEAQELLN